MRRELSLVALALAVLASEIGCDRASAPVPQRGRGLATSSAAGGLAPDPVDSAGTLRTRGGESGSRPSDGPPESAGARPGAATPPVVLDLAVRRKMKLAPRLAAVPDLAFGKGRLGVLTEDALVVRSVAHFEESLDLPLARARAMVALSDGSLFAVGASRSIRLLPQDMEALSVPRLVLLPDSTLFGDRATPDRLWVLPAVNTAGTALFGYQAVRAPGALLMAEQWSDLEGYDGRAFTSLRDGSFLYTEPGGLVRFFGAGPKAKLDSPLKGAVRLLPGSRPDTAWAVAGTRATLYRLLAGKLYRLKSIELGATLYDAAADADLLAVLELSQPDDAPWVFFLEVFDVSGHRHARVTLRADETGGDDWARTLVRDRGLALSAATDPPLVVVGGPTALGVFSARDGRPVFGNL